MSNDSRNSEEILERINRRDLLKASALSAAGISASVMPGVRPAAAAGPRAKHCILLFLNGGPSHLDTWDPKPEAPAEYRGEFRAIPTSVDGLQICEHLPRLARLAQHYAIVRTVTGTEENHERARRLILGRELDHPDRTPTHASFGAPAYVAIPRVLQSDGIALADAGTLPLEAGEPGSRVLPFAEPETTLRHQRAPFHTGGNHSYFSAASEDRSELSPSTRKALDLERESIASRRQYGGGSLGKSCLTSRRLVEAGTRLITISHGGWDTHGGNFPALRDRQLPPLDQALSALLTDLEDRGLLSETLVVCLGEFGRSPRINRNGGRDHHAAAHSVLLAGGGIRVGQVLGSTDALGKRPINRPVSPGDLMATLETLLGRESASGSVVRELVA